MHLLAEILVANFCLGKKKKKYISDPQIWQEKSHCTTRERLVQWEKARSKQQLRRKGYMLSGKSSNYVGGSAAKGVWRRGGNSLKRVHQKNLIGKSCSWEEDQKPSPARAC